ncbi:hypothetical protein TrRE_jg4551 [Triparma retinervis]|uniref:Uncharacterized protein n=1 Tax=Triparma retinervis TaxID=2557542 RepID=A0A9W7A1N7_9STRA|nr:hypothetical protein TrRE_jg4551 [Triparma retinervis]
MFLPDNDGVKKEDELEKRVHLKRVEDLIISRLPPHTVSTASVSVQEIICGDPSCAPIDTAVLIMFDNGGASGQFGLPMEPREVDNEALETFMPPADVISEWHKGNEVDWSPYDDDPSEYSLDPSSLRFQVGSKVQCRVGADPVTGWGNGEVVQVLYRENNWPPGQVAPYKIKLDDGRSIFAPQDTQEVIRERP